MKKYLDQWRLKNVMLQTYTILGKEYIFSFLHVISSLFRALNVSHNVAKENCKHKSYSNSITLDKTVLQKLFLKL
jgi:hypothetical protein